MEITQNLMDGLILPESPQDQPIPEPPPEALLKSVTTSTLSKRERERLPLQPSAPLDIQFGPDTQLTDYIKRKNIPEDNAVILDFLQKHALLTQEDIDKLTPKLSIPERIGDVGRQAISAPFQAVSNIIQFPYRVAAEIGAKLYPENEAMYRQDVRELRQSMQFQPEAQTDFGRMVGNTVRFISEAVLIPGPKGIVGNAANFAVATAIDDADKLASGEMTLGEYVKALGVSGATGGALAGVGQIKALAGNVVLKLAGEYAALVGTPAILEQQMPSKENLLYNAIFLGAFHGINKAIAMLAVKDGVAERTVANNIKAEADNTGQLPSDIAAQKLDEAGISRPEELKTVADLQSQWTQRFGTTTPTSEEMLKFFAEQSSQKATTTEPTPPPTPTITENIKQGVQGETPKAGEVPQVPIKPTTPSGKPLTTQQMIDEAIQQGVPPELLQQPLTIFEKLKEKGVNGINVSQALQDHFNPENIRAVGKKKIGFFRKEKNPGAGVVPFDEAAAAMNISTNDLAEALRNAKTRKEAIEHIKNQLAVQKETNPPIQVNELGLDQGDKFKIAGEDYKVTNKEGELLTIKNKDTFKVTPTDVIPEPDMGTIEYAGTEFPPRGISEQPKYTEEVLRAKTVKELKEIAKTESAQIYGKGTREDIIQSILQADRILKAITQPAIMEQPTVKQLAMTHDQILSAIKEGKITPEEAKNLITKEMQPGEEIVKARKGIERGGVKFVGSAEIADILKRLDVAQRTKTSPEEIIKLKTEFSHLLAQAQIKIDQTQRLADAEGATIDDILTITLPDGRTQQINLARFKDSQGGLTQLDKIVSVLGEAVRGKRTDAELRAEAEMEAENIGLTKVQLENLRKNIGNADKLVVASGIVIKTLDERARLINDAILTDPANEKLAPFLFEALGQQRDVLVSITQIGTEGGRLLRAFGLGVEASKQQVKGLDELIEGFKKENIPIRDLALKFKKLETIKQRNIFLKSPTISDAFLEAWINGLLSPLTTQGANAVGNFTAITGAAIEVGLAEWMPGSSTPPGSMGATLQGLYVGITKALQIIYKANLPPAEGESPIGKTTQVFSPSREVERIGNLLREARRGEMVPGKFGVGRQKAFTAETFGVSNLGILGKAIDLMGEYIRTPGQALMTVDEFSKLINYEMWLHKEAYGTAYHEGLQGEALTNRMNEIVAKPPEDIHLSSENFAFYNTFNQELGPTGRAIQQFAESHVLAKITVPFIQISANLMKYTFERTSLALASQKVRADLFGGPGVKRDMVVAKIAMGSMIMATAAAAAGAGLITGHGPRDPELRKIWLASGKKPDSIKIGDTYYSYARIEPIGSLFGLVARYAEIAQNTDLDTASKIATAMYLPFADVFINKTYLLGLAGTFDAMQNPTTEGPKYVKNLFKTIMPRIGANLARVIDPQIREVHGMLDALAADTPGWSMTLPPRRDIFGNPQMYEGGYANLVSPVYIATEKHDPVIDEILKQQVSISMPANYLGGVKPPSFGQERPIHGIQLDPYQYDRLVQIIGKEIKSDGHNLHDTLAVIMKTPFYQAMSEGQDGGRAKIIRTVVDSFKESGKAKFLMENPAIRGAIQKKQIQQQSALQPPVAQRQQVLLPTIQ